MRKKSSKTSYKKLARLFSVTLVLFSAVVFAGLAFFYYYYANRIAAKNFNTYVTVIDTQFNQYQQTFADIGSLCASNDKIQNAVFSSSTSAADSPMSTQELLEYITDTNSAIDSIFLISKDGVKISTSSASDPYTDTISSRYQNTGSFSFQGSFYCTVPSSDTVNSKPLLFYIFPLQSKADASKRAVGGVLCNVESLIQGIHLNDFENSILTIEYQGTTVASNRILSDEENLFVSSTSESGIYKYNNENWNCNVSSISNMDWKVKYLVPQNTLMKEANYFRNISLFLVLIILVVMIVLFILLTRAASRPVSKLVSDIRLIQNGDKDRTDQVNVEEYDEIGNAINDLLVTINTEHEKQTAMQTNLYQSMLAQTRAQIYAYRMQINPHFLFNTMECMRSMASYYNIPDLESMVSALANMFRYTLHSSALSTLDDELKHIQYYCSIMNHRVTPSCNIVFNIADDAKSMKLPSIILQPIVENSYLHGFKKPYLSDFHPEITITALSDSFDGTRILKVMIRDNGCGMNEEDLSKLRESLLSDSSPICHSSIGLRNIYQRCKLIFETSTMTINSEEGKYTEIILSIPQQENTLVSMLSL